MYKMKHGGVTYEVTVNEDGTTEYNPPLPESLVKRSKQRLKEMCQKCVAPGLRTDTTWHAGRGTLLDQMDGDEIYTDYLVKQARKKGYNPGANDVYIGQLADSDGDRKAWFKPGEGTSEMRKRLIASGKGCDSPRLHVEPRTYTPKPKKLINEKIARNFEAQYRKSGEADGMSKQQLRQYVIDKHARKPS